MKKTCYNNKYKIGIILFRPFPFALEGNREKTGIEWICRGGIQPTAGE